jgi:hypothetical protein
MNTGTSSGTPASLSVTDAVEKGFFWQVNQIFQHRRCVLRALM